MKLFNWLKGALCLIAVALLGNALGVEYVTQMTEFVSETGQCKDFFCKFAPGS